MRTQFTEEQERHVIREDGFTNSSRAAEGCELTGSLSKMFDGFAAYKKSGTKGFREWMDKAQVPSDSCLLLECCAPLPWGNLKAIGGFEMVFFKHLNLVWYGWIMPK